MPLVTEILDYRNIYSLIFYLGLAVLLDYIIRGPWISAMDRSKINKDQLSVGVSMAFLVVPFLPSSGIVFRVGFVIAER